MNIAEEGDSKRQLSRRSPTPSIGSKKDDAEVDNVLGNSEFAYIFSDVGDEGDGDEGEDVGDEGDKHEVRPNMEDDDEITPVEKVETKPNERRKRKLPQLIPQILSKIGKKKRKVGHQEAEANVPEYQRPTLPPPQMRLLLLRMTRKRKNHQPQLLSSMMGWAGVLCTSTIKIWKVCSVNHIL